MLIIPDFLPAVIWPLWSHLLVWFSPQVYARLLAPSDFRVQLTQHLNLSPWSRPVRPINIAPAQSPATRCKPGLGPLWCITNLHAIKLPKRCS